MNNVTKLEFEQKHHILEVDGIGYEIPQRTAALEKELQEHDKNAGSMSEYEGNMALLGILFGKANAKKMFPDGENTNLDKLAKCVKLAISLFMDEYSNIQQEELNQKMEQMAPYMNTLASVENLAKNIPGKKGSKRK